MKLFQAFKTDKTAEVEGVWRSLGSNGQIKVARLGNKVAQAAWNQAAAELREQMDSPDPVIKETANREAMIRSMAAGILVDWKGMMQDDGSEMPYTKELARGALEMDDFRVVVYQLASEMEAYLVSTIEKQMGNSSPG